MKDYRHCHWVPVKDSANEKSLTDWIGFLAVIGLVAWILAESIVR